jgi:acetyltransferase-like isoleucine patch superfamily enzyme
MALSTLKRTLRLRHVFEVFFNMVVTHIPARWVRLRYLRMMGARIGDHSTLFRGCRILAPQRLVVGQRCAIAWAVVLDARGGLTFEDDVVVASDCQFITAEHDISRPDFADVYAPIVVGRWAWIGTRAMVFKGVTVGEGGVIAGGAVAVRDVPPYTVVGGVPAKPIGKRATDLDYDPTYHPLFY